MARSKSSAEGPRGYYEPSARNDALRKTSGEETAMSEERTVDAESQNERSSVRTRSASTAAAERARETSKVAQQWWGRALWSVQDPPKPLEPDAPRV